MDKEGREAEQRSDRVAPELRVPERLERADAADLVDGRVEPSGMRSAWLLPAGSRAIPVPR